jgi:hypothetical protein
MVRTHFVAERHKITKSIDRPNLILLRTTPLMFDLGAAAFTEVAEEKVLKAELE